MVDKNMHEMRIHGDKGFPVGVYEWYGPDGTTNGLVLECHWHEGWEFFEVVKGCAQFSVNGRKRLIRENDILLIPGSSLHMAECENEQMCSYRSVVFAMPMLFGNIDDVVQKKYITPMFDNHINADVLISNSDAYSSRVQACIQKIFDAMYERPMAYEMLTKAYIYESLACAFPLMDFSEEADAGQRCLASTEYVKQAILYMLENYQQPITITQLAELVNMSVGYFGKLFREMTSYSPIDYLKNLRLSKAADQLIATNEKVLNIALDTGFNNIGYFIRAFSQKYGVTPYQYRKEMRK